MTTRSATTWSSATHCVLYLEQTRATAAALHRLPADALPAPARQRLLDLFSVLHPGR
jgi:hypothetical protein